MKHGFEIGDERDAKEICGCDQVRSQAQISVRVLTW
jgi:hypothetical protein